MVTTVMKATLKLIFLSMHAHIVASLIKPVL